MLQAKSTFQDQSGFDCDDYSEWDTMPSDGRLRMRLDLAGRGKYWEQQCECDRICYRRNGRTYRRLLHLHLSDEDICLYVRARDQDPRVPCAHVHCSNSSREISTNYACGTMRRRIKMRAYWAERVKEEMMATVARERW
ncbi:hypothetical protein BDZ89DRAFT_1058121 [Hymenopellis radicata]|nr:hypothetical protein BDZ89DRAFT_1058121 [Hymenopellis radicata]